MMKKIICIILSVMLLGVVFAAAASAAAPEVKIHTTIAYQKEKQLSHTNTGSYPVYESTYKYLVIERVMSLNECATVEKTASGWVVTFVKQGNAKILIDYHNRETYSKYNTEEQVVYNNYDKSTETKTKYEDYKVLSLADSYKVPDGYVGVYKDGHEYIDFASQEVINAKFGNSTLVRYANLHDFFGFSYTFENNVFNVTLDNFTGHALYFRCPKKDTTVMIHLKGTSSLDGTMMVFNKEVTFSAIAATGAKSVIWIDAGEKGATLNVKMEAVQGKHDSGSYTRYVPFYAWGGTEIVSTTQNHRPIVNVNLTTDAVVGDRAVNLALGDLSLADADFNYTYKTTRALKNYSGVTGKLFLNEDTIFTGTLNNTQISGNADEYLFPRITYASNFTGGAYFECRGGKLISSSKNEVFIPNNLLKYETTAEGVQYRAVTSSNDDLLTRVDLSYIAPAFPEVRVNNAMPKLMEGVGFKAGLTWTDESNQNADYVDKGHTYRARAAFVPTKGYYLYLRDLMPSELAKVKPACASGVYNVPLPNTNTTYFDVLNFQLYQIKNGSPTITIQPKSVYADPGETIYFNVSVINSNPAPDGIEWHSVTDVKVLGVTIPWDTKLSDSSVYSGTSTASLKVNVNSNLYKVKYYYCKVNGTGWESVKSSRVTITQPKRITRISLGGEQDPLPGRTPDSSYAYGRDWDNVFYSDFYKEDVAPSLDTNSYTSSSNSPAAKLDYSSASSTTDGCFWYKGESNFSHAPARMPLSEKFVLGGTYTYRFRVLAKTGYKFSDDVAFTHDNGDNMEAQAHKVSDTEYLVDFTYKNIKRRFPLAGDTLIFRDVPVLYENAGFQETATVQEGAVYTLYAQEGWLESPDSTSTVQPQYGGTYYIHYTVVAKEGNVFDPNTGSGYSSTCYSAEDGTSLSIDKSVYKVSDKSNTTLEVYLGFKCNQRRVKDLTLKGLKVPCVGDKLGTTAGVDPDSVTVTAVKYYDASFTELSSTYVPKAKDMLTVSVYVKAKDGVSFAPDATMTWTVAGNKLSANAKKDAGMTNSERRFDFNVSAHEHEWINAENVTYLKETATCTHGTIYYQSCAFCEAQGSKTFEMNDKMPHATAKTAAKAATCTVNGNIEYYTCSTCGKLFKDAAGKNEIKAADTVIKAGHKLTKTAAKAATCTANGNITYYTCSVCKKLFKDDKGTTAITAADTVIKAIGHKYGAWTKLNDTQHQRVCSNDKNHVEKANHTWDAGKVTTAPTAAADGVKTYTCTVCNATKTEKIPKLGYLIGDVDGNGKVESADARYALRAAVGLDDTAHGLDFSSKTNRCFLAADVTKDGKIGPDDARLILRASVGLEILS